MFVGRRDFAPYRTPGACVQAAWAVAHLVMRAAVDTAAYAPDRDTVPQQAMATARACGAQFDLQRVAASDTTGRIGPMYIPAAVLDLVHLALITQDEAKAHAAAERYVAALPKDPAARRWALFALDTTYLNAIPMRLADAEAVTAQLDSLGSVAVLQRGMAHARLLTDAYLRYDTTRVRREVLAVLSLVPQLSAADLNDIDAQRQNNPVFDLFFLNVLSSSASPAAWTQSWTHTLSEIRSTGYSLNEAELLQAMHAFRMDWALQHLGQPVSPLQVPYWHGVDSSAHQWPVPGKVSVYVPAAAFGGERDAAMWRRLHHKYGAALNIMVIYKTQGYFHDSPPLTPAQEADSAAHYYLDALRLPALLAVDTAAYQRLPDGRRVDGPAAYEQNPYYCCYGFALADRTGKLVFLTPSMPQEHMIELWIDRVMKAPDERQTKH
jgi:hypothetical protein